MNNQEIKDYMHQWVAAAKEADTKGKRVMAFAIAIPVLLAEIALRLPEAKP